MKNAPLLTMTILLALASGACESPARESAPTAPASGGTAPSAGRRVAITVDAQGYHPSSVEVAANEAITLVVTRTSDMGCGQQLVIPDLDIRRDLPLDTPVEIMIRPTHGPLRFTCGMNMYEGTIVVH